MTRRFVGPGWRIGGAIGAWLVFAFCFTTLYLAAAELQGLGGFCASGGPYVIETQCPDAVAIFMPVSMWGIFLAAGIAIVFQRGFATPLLVWGWPILFIGLGIQFLMWIGQGAIFVGLLCGILFLIMGAVPLFIELRAGLQRPLLGRTSAFDVRFIEREGLPRTFYMFGRDEQGEAIAPTAGDWALSLGVFVVAAGGGVLLGLLAFAAAAGGSGA
ncbi:MAG: hypothetical protein KF727_09245 [Microbacteriaceae bacterium]|nr:hypothetical protein [Microbacteriaceae bacterium]